MSHNDSNSEVHTTEDNAHQRQDPELRPNKFSKLIVRHPQYVILFVIGVVLLMCGAIFGIGLFEIAEAGPRDYQIRGHPATLSLNALQLLQKLAYDGAEDEIDSNVQEAIRSEVANSWNVIIMYESRDDNLLTTEDIQTMNETEQFILNHHLWPYLCFADMDAINETYTDPPGPTCSADSYSSFVEFVDPSITQEQLENQTHVLGCQMGLGDLFFDKDFTCENEVSVHARSFFRLGVPIFVNRKDGPFKNGFDRKAQQQETFDEFIDDVIDFVLNKASTDVLIVRFFGDNAIGRYFEEVANKDFLWTLASMVFVVTYMTIHTRSLFLACMTMLQIILAMPFAYFIYRAIFQISFFQQIHFLAIFVLLGIGADDCFVFTDAWNQAPATHTSLSKPENLAIRMAWTHRRASKAMLITSLTTSVAFFATTISKIAPIASFGIFAGWLIICNYILVITFYPACVVIWHTRFRDVRTCCWKKSKEDDPYYEESDSGQTNLKFGSTKDPDKTTELRTVEKFFANQWAPFVIWARIPLIIAFALFLAISLWASLQLKPVEESQNIASFLPEDHFISRSFQAFANEFDQTDDDSAMEVTLVWGSDGVDMSETNRWEPNEIGRLVLDSDFDLSSTENQLAFLETCRETAERDGVFDGKVRCFLEDFVLWTELNSNNYSFPVHPERFNAALYEFSLDPMAEEFVAAKDFGFHSGELLYVSITATTEVKLEQTVALQPHYDSWEDYEGDLNARLPNGINNVLQTASDESWIIMALGQGFVTNAIQGMALSIIVAFVAVTFSTMNLLIGLYSTVAIIGIISGLGMMIVYVGWELGTSESIAMVIMIGLSVDYTVHFGNAYVESHKQSRAGRLTDALRYMGISVLAGAITTLGASMFLFGPVLIFFRKFGAMIAFTLIFSLLWSLMGFMAMNAAYGPEGKCADLRHCCWWNYCFKKRSDNQYPTENGDNIELGNIHYT